MAEIKTFFFGNNPTRSGALMSGEAAHRPTITLDCRYKFAHAVYVQALKAELPLEEVDLIGAKAANYKQRLNVKNTLSGESTDNPQIPA